MQPLPLNALRQSVAELLAYAICDVFPGTHLVNSGITNIDFYYDVIAPIKLDAECLLLLEERMRHLKKEAFPVRTLDMMRENAIQFLLHNKQPIKAEIAKHIASNTVRILQIEDFIDLCSPPYMTQTDQAEFFELQSVTPMNIYIKHLGNFDVMRIRGTAFHEKSDLKNQLKKMKRAKKYDHWSVGLEMELFAPSPSGKDSLELGQKSFHWLPKGSALIHHLFKWLNGQQLAQGYEILEFPTIIPLAFSSHSSKYNQLTFTEINEQEFICAPPAPLLPLSSAPLSSNHYYGRMPAYNHAPNDQLQGLLNPRSALLDLAQILCNQEQLQEELNSSLHFINKCIKILGFEHHWYLAVNQNTIVGQEKSWVHSYHALENALKENGLNYTVDKQIERRYGPRVELGLLDATGREWRASFISIDLIQLIRGDKIEEGINPSDKGLRISYSVFGFIERFIAILIEHFAGDLPLWLVPEQIRLIPLSVKNGEYGKKIQSQLETAGFRCKIDPRPLPLGERIHLAEKERIPYCVIVGEKEEKNDVITVRSSQKGQTKDAITIEFFLNQLQAALQKGHGV